MATFGSGLIQGLLNPSYSAELGNVAQQISAAPGIRRERERQANRLERAMDITGKGIASAQAGDTSALSAQMGQLRELIKDPNMPIEEKQLYIQEIRALQGMMPGARQTATGNTARSIIQTRAAIEDPTLPENVKKVLEQRLKVMSDNTDALAAADKFRLDQARMDSEMQRIEGENWLNKNTSKMLELIRNDDADGLEAFVAGAGQFSGAARKFATSALAGQEAMDRFTANSIAMKMAPDFKTGEGGEIISAERSDIESLPESIREIFAPGLRKYEKLIKEGWDDKNGTWREGYRTLASNAQREVQGLLNNVRNQIATSEYFAELNRTRDTEEQIRNLELLKESPVSKSEARILADSLLPRNKKGNRLENLTVERINEAEEIIRQSRNAAIDNQINMLRSPQTEGEQETGVGSVIEGSDGQKYKASDYRGKEAVDDDGNTVISDGQKWIPVLKEVTVSARKRSETPPKKPTSASDIYGEPFISQGAAAVGRAVDAAGQAISDKAARQRQRIQEEPFGGVR